MNYRRGNLRENSLPRLLIDLNRNRRTGVLTIHTTASTKKIYLEKGIAVFASSTHEDERFGEMLIKAGKINIEQYNKSVEMLKKTGKRQGAVLVELGFLKPQDLIWGVKYQVKEIIYSLFQIEEARYEFDEGPLPLNEVVTLKMSMGNLIYEGVKRIENLTMIMRELPDMNSVLVLSSDPLNLYQSIVLGPRDKKMLAMVDGKTTVKDLLGGTGASDFDTMKTLYVLLSAGIVEPKKEEAVQEHFESISIDDILESISKEQVSLSTRAEEIHPRLGNLAPHELLEIDESAKDDTVRKSYYKLVKEFHPDKYLNIAEQETIDKVLEIVDRVNKAYSMLNTAAKRKEYFGKQAGAAPKVDARQKEKAEGPSKKAAESPVNLEDADLFIAQGMYQEAMSIYDMILSADPKNTGALQRKEELKALIKMTGA